MRKAPFFSLLDQAGKTRTLDEFAGKWLILYFYPKDDTPRCTTEACAFRDDYDVLTDKGVKVVGISGDSIESHAKFAEKYHLTFPLLSDVEGKVVVEYGANGLLGIKRKTCLIAPSGEIVKEYEKVTPEGHAADIMEDIDSLRNKN